MKKQEVIEFLLKKGLKQDRWGNFTFIKNGTTFRYKLNKTSIRFERKLVIPAEKYLPKKTSWIRIVSGYYSKLSIVNDNLVGLTR